ncbi:dihydrofolate reductase [Acinetobacter baumannii]
MIQLVFAHCGTAFGSHDGMPWPRISQDFKNFKARTEGTILVMGAKTFMSLPSLLPGRDHIVVCDTSRDTLPKCKSGKSAHSYISYGGFEHLLTVNSVSPDHKFSVIGGVELLEKAIDYADVIYETSINMSPSVQPNVEITASLPKDFLTKVDNFGKVMESHWYSIQDGLTITEWKSVKV